MQLAKKEQVISMRNFKWNKQSETPAPADPPEEHYFIGANSKQEMMCPDDVIATSVPGYYNYWAGPFIIDDYKESPEYLKSLVKSIEYFEESGIHEKDQYKKGVLAGYRDAVAQIMKEL